MTKHQVLVIGGGETHQNYEKYLNFLKKELKFDPTPRTTKNWKQNLSKYLGDKYEIIHLSMPCAMNAQYREWSLYFAHVLPFLRDDVVIIGHSLGGLFIMKYLEENKVNIKIKAILLVAAPFNLVAWREFADFYLPRNCDLHIKGVEGSKNPAEHIHIFQSEDDTIVPPINATRYKQLLPQAVVHMFKNRFHFIKDPSFPELNKVIRKLVS